MLQKSPFIVASFYTEGTPYEDEARRLVASLDALGIAHDVCAVRGRGSWVRNCAMKAEFVGEKLVEHKMPVLWLDADAEVLRPLEAFADPDFEFAVWECTHPGGPALGPWASGTVFFAYCERALALVEDWRALGVENQQWLDQLTLFRAWSAMEARPVTHFLPWSYTCIYDAKGRPADPHVIHHQASRRLKNAVRS